MPRIIQLASDGSGRYIGRPGWDLWRDDTKRQKDGGEGYIQWKPLPRSSRGTTEPRLVEYLK